jgi:GTPase
MFTDRVEITVSSGKGGAGAVAFHREKFITEGGPSGGDGGDGGSVTFLADPNADSLNAYRGKHHHRAKNGVPGLNKCKKGAHGEGITIVVPVGTQVIDSTTKELLLDLAEAHKPTLFLKGGKGGMGNTHFRSSSNQKPTYAQKGLPGEERRVFLELKLIADVGLVGFPNVGKSTLISTVSAAKPEIADYEFTTLKPNLGVVQIDDYSSFVWADIPGIIEGASEGKGLGLEFLRHIERTKVNLFCLDIARIDSLEKQFVTLSNELHSYSEKLSQNKSAIAITKIDAFLPEDANAKILEFMSFLDIKPNALLSEYSAFITEDDRSSIIPISSAANTNINTLKFEILKTLRK